MNGFEKGHLRLVTEVSEERPKRRSWPRHRFPDAHRKALARALHLLRERRYGNWWRLAEALEMPEATLVALCSGVGGSHGMAYRVAQLMDIPLEALLAGKIFDVKKCPECGQCLAQDKEKSNG